MRRAISAAVTGAVCLFQAAAGELPHLESPLPIPLVLSGNFGELRNNHFHSGLDFKTNGRIGYKVGSVADGYVSRIVVSPWGFGRAVYVTHPELGLTTVYGHLDSFASKIDALAKAEQYGRETFDLDMSFTPEQLPVTSGETIGISGNAGSSGGPHLHMDVRDAATGDALDPMPYFRDRIADNVAPQARQLALYPTDRGVVGGSRKAAYRSPEQFSSAFTAWGEVVPALKAYDRMTGTTNIYGVKYLTFKVDGRQVWRRTIDRVDLNRTRAINTLVNYPDKHRKGSWMMVTRVADANPLEHMIEVENGNGVLVIDQERDYPCEFVMEDDHGNRSSVRFVVRGVRADIPDVSHKGALFRHDKASRTRGHGLDATFPSGAFYDDFYFTSSMAPDTAFCSNVYTLGSPEVPLSGAYDVVMDLTVDTVADKRRYCVVQLDGGKQSAVATTYDHGRVSARPNRLGRFAVTVDDVAPSVVPVGRAKWPVTGVVKYKMTDNLSGVRTYRGEIDGRFVLFELDGKTATASFRLDPARVDKNGGTHRVVMTVTDGCGNETTVTDTFRW